ncbi:MAG: HPr family phosphocarrier protein [Phycisphaerae bacterium]|nr:HPr family phosphocarrier protein [Phycisphaerae bacterium]
MAQPWTDVLNVVVEREVVIPNKEGLHFRPIMQFVDTAQRFAADVTVKCEGREADGRSPMELLMLVATHGTRVRLVADGDDAEAALEALSALIESGFGET